MRAVPIAASALAALLAVACEPTPNVRSPALARAQDRAGVRGGADAEPLGFDETRDLDDDTAPVARVPASPAARVALTADTDPARIEGATVARDVGPTFACTIPGAPGPAFCARAVAGPFVVTDLQTAPGCGPHAFASAIGGKGGDGARWTMSGPLAVHGARLLVGAGEALFVGAVAEAPPAPAPAAVPPADARRAKRAAAAPPAPSPTPLGDARCTVTWSGFHPYAAASEPARGARSVEHALDVPATRPDVLAPTPPLGGAGATPRRVYDRLEGARPTSNPSTGARRVDGGF